jgi:hypothetical protein
MRMLAIVGLALAALVSLATTSDAGGRRFGSCYSSSYYYPSYSYGYSYYPSYSYAPAYQAPAYAAPAQTIAYSKDWKTEALEIARQQNDYQDFLKVAGALGLNVNGAPVAQQAGYGYNAAPPVQGDTVFGYTVQQLQAFYGDNSRLVTGQQLARTVDGARELHHDLAVGQLAIAQADTSRLAVVAEILARGTAASQVARSAGKAVEPQPQTITQTTIQGNGGQVVQQAATQDSWTNAKSACVACHSGATALGKFDVNSEWTKAQKATVWERITTADQSKFMPRDLKDRTKPGPALTPEQFAEFYKRTH